MNRWTHHSPEEKLELIHSEVYTAYKPEATFHSPLLSPLQMDASFTSKQNFKKKKFQPFGMQWVREFVHLKYF